jgi:hypothetical protein
MAEVVSCRALTAEARVQSRANPCGTSGGRSGTGTGFPPNTFDLGYTGGPPPPPPTPPGGGGAGDAGEPSI